MGDSIATLINDFRFHLTVQASAKEGEEEDKKIKNIRVTWAHRYFIHRIEPSISLFSLVPDIRSLIECAGPASRCTGRCPAIHSQPGEIENEMQPFVIVRSMPDFSARRGDPSTGFLRINKLPTSVDTFPNFWRILCECVLQTLEVFKIPVDWDCLSFDLWTADGPAYLMPRLAAISWGFGPS